MTSVLRASTSIAPYISPAFHRSGVREARRSNRCLAYDRGQRNAYAVAPDFKPVRTSLNDDGVVLTDLSISDDGSTVACPRQRAVEAVANPSTMAGADLRARTSEERHGGYGGHPHSRRRSLGGVREGWSDRVRVARCAGGR